LIHTVYITTNPSNGKFYIGKHSTSKKNDNYKGSGVWVKKCKQANIHLSTVLVAVCQSSKDAYDFERVLVKAAKEQHKNLCMNFSDGGVGYSPEERAKMPSYMLGKKHTQETKNKLSELGKKNRSGVKHHMYGKKHTEDTKKQMSESHRKIGHLRGTKVKCVTTGQIFNSLADAGRFVNGSPNSRNNIRKCCDGLIKKIYGLEWSYIKE